MAKADTALILLPLYVFLPYYSIRVPTAVMLMPVGFPLTDPAKGEPSDIVRCEQINEGAHSNKLRRDNY